MYSSLLKPVLIITLMLTLHVQHAKVRTEVRGGMTPAQTKQPAANSDSQQKAQAFEEMSIEKRLKGSKSRLMIQEHRLEALREAPESTPSPSSEASSDSSAAIQLREQLQVARQQLMKLQARYTDIYPDVIAAREQVTNLMKLLNAESAATSSHPKQVTESSGSSSQRTEEIEQVTASIETLKQEVAEEEHQALQLISTTTLAGENRKRNLRSRSLLPSSRVDAFEGGEPLKHAPEPTATNLPKVPVATSAGLAISQVRSSPRHPVTSGLFDKVILGFVSLACLASVLLLYILKRRKKIIQDHLSLQEMLRDKADYVGWIPKMESI